MNQNQLIYATPDMPYPKIRSLVENNNIVLFKNKFSSQLINSFKLELLNWKRSSPPLSNNTPYPDNLRNFHLPIISTENPATAGDIEFDLNKTNVMLYNFRIGDSQDKEIINKIPTSQKILPEILSMYKKINPDCAHLPHGTYFNKNLFFEIVHYPCGFGYFEKHTHFNNFNDGQRYNLILGMSTIEMNYEKGGLLFHINGHDHDLTNLFCAGDLIACRMDLPHSVTKVESKQESHYLEQNGRWSMGLFYY